MAIPQPISDALAALQDAKDSADTTAHADEAAQLMATQTASARTATVAALAEKKSALLKLIEDYYSTPTAPSIAARKR